MCISKQFLFFGLLIPGILFPIWTHGQQKVTNERIWDTLGNMTQHYDARVIQFSKEPVVLHRTIFLGNSITEMDNWKTLTNDTTVVNRGISGDVTFGVLARLNDVVK